jgi:hypothetical protein
MTSQSKDDKDLSASIQKELQMGTSSLDDSELAHSESEYKVGYGRPPIHSRFKLGTSGNPNGRPPKLRNVAREIQDIYRDSLSLRDGTQLPGIVALVQRILIDAINGDIRSMVLCYKIAKDFGVFTARDRICVDVAKLSPEMEELIFEAALIFNRLGVLDHAP